MKDKIVEAYDALDRRVYWYSDKPADSISIAKADLEKARVNGRIYFAVGNKDVIAWYYKEENNSLVIVAGAYDEAGNEKLRQLRWVLSRSKTGVRA